MADLNINKSETAHLWEDAGNNLIPNATFENAPSFTAATNVTSRWIDGTAGGSITNDIYNWAIIVKQSTIEASFDSTVSHSGTYSLKLSTISTNAFVDVRLSTAVTVVITNRYYIPILPSTTYKATFWMKTNFVSGNSSDGAYLTFVEYDGSSATATQVLTGSSKVKTTTDWTQYSIQFTTASTSVLITPAFRVYGHTGTATLIMDAWYDDIFLQAVSPNGPQITVSPIITPGIQDITGPKIWS